MGEPITFIEIRGFWGRLAPQKNQRKDGEEKHKPQNKSKKIASPRKALAHVIIFKESLFFNDSTLLPWLGRLLLHFPRSRLERAGEAAGGGLTGVMAEGGVRVGRGAHGAEDWGGVEGGGGLLAIMGVAGWALHVVEWPARGPCGRGALLFSSSSLHPCFLFSKTGGHRPKGNSTGAILSSFCLVQS